MRMKEVYNISFTAKCPNCNDEIMMSVVTGGCCDGCGFELDVKLEANYNSLNEYNENLANVGLYDDEGEEIPFEPVTELPERNLELEGKTYYWEELVGYKDEAVCW